MSGELPYSTIVSTGNIYIAGNIRYSTPPPSLPENADIDDIDLYLIQHEVKNANSLALVAGGNIVIGDYTSSAWRKSVSRRIRDQKEDASEDSGIDSVPETAKGRDGIKGTIDDDLLEKDVNDRFKKYTPGVRWNGEYEVRDRISSAVFNHNINKLCEFLELYHP